MEQFTNLIEFRQAVFEHGFTKASDAQFEIIDALLLGQPIRSFPELSLLPVFRRQWHSSYAAIEKGNQDWEWLEWHFIQQIPAKGTKLFSLDGTAWPHPAAWTLADRQYVFSPTPAAAPPQTRGKSPGWPQGRPRTRPHRCRVVKKGKKKPELT